MRVVFLKSGEVTWTSKSGKTEKRRYIPEGTALDLRIVPQGDDYELWDGNWSILMPGGNIFIDKLSPLDPFTMAYLECALWSTTDESNEQGGDPLDENYDPEDIAIETLESMIADCKRFQEENATDIAAGPDGPDYTVWERAGHDFWLTRNGHGAGFWDGDWPEEVGERLTEASKAFGEVWLCVGDDGLIY